MDGVSALRLILEQAEPGDLVVLLGEAELVLAMLNDSGKTPAVAGAA